MNILLAVFLGGLFGYALYTVGAAKRSNIRSMLRLENLELMKIILFAIGFASSLLALTTWMGFFELKHLSIKEMHAGVLLGGLIFGVGFGALGGCPGTVLAALPYTNKIKTLAMIFGGLFGAWAFSLSYGWWQEQGLFAAWNLGKLTLFQLSEAYPAVFVWGPEGLLFLGALLMLTAWLIPKQFI